VTALEPAVQEFYRQSMMILNRGRLRFLVGGAYALERYTGIGRHTKDFDIFVKPDEADAVLDAFARAGYQTEVTFPHWLGKAHRGEEFVDVIFRSGNGIAVVDDGWFAHAVREEVFGLPALLCPAEEMIWSKGFVMERERFDGADIAHLIRARGPDLDWRRLLRRFGPHWRVLFSHLLLFGFIYPGERNRIPEWVMRELFRRADRDLMTAPPRHAKVCQGTLLSRQQYLIDLEQWGYADARAVEQTMSAEDIALWTAGIEVDGSK
jgi:hypothetical protein